MMSSYGKFFVIFALSALVFVRSADVEDKESMMEEMAKSPQMVQYMKDAAMFVDQVFGEFMDKNCQDMSEEKCKEYKAKMADMVSKFKEHYLNADFLCESMFVCEKEEIEMEFPKCFSCLTFVNIMKDEEFMKMSKEVAKEMCVDSDEVNEVQECLELYDDWMNVMKKIFTVNTPLKICELNKNCRPSEEVVEVEISVNLEEPIAMDKIHEFAVKMKQKIAEYINLNELKIPEVDMESKPELEMLQAETADEMDMDKEHDIDMDYGKEPNMDKDHDHHHNMADKMNSHDMAKETLMDLIKMKFAHAEKSKKVKMMRDLYFMFMMYKNKYHKYPMKKEEHPHQKEIIDKVYKIFENADNKELMNQVVHLVKGVLMWNKHYKMDKNASSHEYMDNYNKLDKFWKYMQDKKSDPNNQYEKIMNMFKMMQGFAKNNDYDTINMFKVRVDSPETNIVTELFKNMQVFMNKMEIEEMHNSNYPSKMKSPSHDSDHKLSMLMKESSEHIENMKKTVHAFFEKVLAHIDVEDLEKLVDLVKENMNMDDLKQVVEMIFPNIDYHKIKEIKHFIHMMVERVKNFDYEKIDDMIEKVYNHVKEVIDKDQLKMLIQMVKEGEIEMLHDVLYNYDMEKLKNVHKVIRAYMDADDMKDFMYMLFKDHNNSPDDMHDHSDKMVKDHY